MKTEIKIQRKWVKKAGIAFVVIMLLLTFFSKTIMNASLPEVSIQAVKAGQMNVSIHGSGTPRALLLYEIMIKQTKTVKDVLVQPGDFVNVGDVLFTLEEGESMELKAALNVLDDMKFQYQRMVLQRPDHDYVLDDSEIAQIRASLQDAIDRRDSNKVSNSELSAAESSYLALKNEVEMLSIEMDVLQDELNQYSGATDEMLLSLERQIEDKKWEIQNALSEIDSDPSNTDNLQQELAVLHTQYENLLAANPEYYEGFMRLEEIQSDLHSTDWALGAAQSDLGEDTALISSVSSLQQEYDRLLNENPAYIQVLAHLDEKQTELQSIKAELVDAQTDRANEEYLTALQDKMLLVEDEIGVLKAKSADFVELATVFQQIQSKEFEMASFPSTSQNSSGDVERLEVELARLEEDYQVMLEKNTQYHRVSDELAQLKVAMNEKTANMQMAQDKYESLSDRYANWELAKVEVSNLQNRLDALQYGLDAKKRSDRKSTTISNLELANLQKDIEEQTEVVEELRDDVSNERIVSSRAGIVQSVNIAAGGIISPNTTLAVIETAEKGYILSFSVSREQSEKFSIGDKAKVDSSDISAELYQIKTDPNGQDDYRIFVFKLEGGDISDKEYSLTLTKPGKLYDLIIPKSALYSDSNGYFVLVVKSKGTPFGARYIAQRVAVEVLEQHDQEVAISASLREGDYVILTSSKPLNSGMQIRMTNG